MGYVTLALRLGIGGLLIVSGVLKAMDGPAATVASVAGYRLLPHFIVTPFGVILPYFEIILGAYLAVGLFTRAAAWVAAGLFTVFTLAVASAAARGLTVSCGCFGANHVEHPTWLHVTGDALLVLGAILIARWAPGTLAVDSTLAKPNHPESTTQRGSTTA